MGMVFTLTHTVVDMLTLTDLHVVAPDLLDLTRLLSSPLFLLLKQVLMVLVVADAVVSVDVVPLPLEEPAVAAEERLVSDCILHRFQLPQSQAFPLVLVLSVSVLSEPSNF